VNKYITAFIAVFFLGGAFASLDKKKSKTIILTIDDTPLPGTKLFKSPSDRAKAIIETLAEKKAYATVFVVGDHLREFTSNCLEVYDTSSRIVIGNHTQHHSSLSKVGAGPFIKEILETDLQINRYKRFKPFFRYPYLDIGTAQKRAQILTKTQYATVPVTIPDYDYEINKLVRKALYKKKAINFDKLRRFYLSHMMENVNTLASNFIDESGAHVLLMHDNDLTALYLGDLIDALRSEGWEIISIEEGHGKYAKLNRDVKPNIMKTIKAVSKEFREAEVISPD
jgi:peptidoglycan-N-acetylglucosamine deacetylase